MKRLIDLIRIRLKWLPTTESCAREMGQREAKTYGHDRNNPFVGDLAKSFKNEIWGEGYFLPFCSDQKEDFLKYTWQNIDFSTEINVVLKYQGPLAAAWHRGYGEALWKELKSEPYPLTGKPLSK